MERYEELSEMSGKAKISYVRQEDETIKEMLRILQNENKEYKEISKREKNAATKIYSALKLIKYFQHFHDH